MTQKVLDTHIAWWQPSALGSPAASRELNNTSHVRSSACTRPTQSRCPAHQTQALELAWRTRMQPTADLTAAGRRCAACRPSCAARPSRPAPAHSGLQRLPLQRAQCLPAVPQPPCQRFAAPPTARPSAALSRRLRLHERRARALSSLAPGQHMRSHVRAASPSHRCAPGTAPERWRVDHGAS